MTHSTGVTLKRGQLQVCNNKIVTASVFLFQIQKEVVKHTWKGDIQTKEQLIMARQKNIEQLWHFEEEDKIREKSMQVGKLQRKSYPNSTTPF